MLADASNRFVLLTHLTTDGTLGCPKSRCLDLVPLQQVFNLWIFHINLLLLLMLL